MRFLLSGTVLVLLCLPSLTNAQHTYSPSAILPSSDAVAMAKYASSPTGLYTGIPEISIPLYQVGNKEFSVPLALRYHASGKREYETSSWVGEGWSLANLGTITRVINGTSDFGAKGYIGSALPFNHISTDFPFLDETLAGQQDTGPDIFYYNFNGYVGKFMFTSTGELLTDHANMLDIKPLQNELDEWVIRDSEGYKYIFGGDGRVEQVGFKNLDKYAVSSWYLKSIVTPIGELIEYTYHPSEKIPVQHEKIKREITFSASTPLYVTSEVVEAPTHHYVPYLSKITLKQGAASIEIIFTSGHGREDSKIAADVYALRRALTKIEVVKKQGNTNTILRSFEFGYKNESEGLWLTGIYQLSPSNKPVSSVKLTYTGITESAIYTSYGYDYWGFYNQQNGSGYPLVAYKADGTHVQFTNGSDKHPIEAHALLGSLSQIEYSAGKIVDYTFELNSFENFSMIVPDVSLRKRGAGIRIKSIATHEKDGQPITTNFHYLTDAGTSSGYLYALPITYFETKHWAKVNGDQYFRLHNVKIRSNTIIPSVTHLLDGPLIGYSRVISESPGRGRTIYTFKNQNYPITTTAENYNRESLLSTRMGLDFRNGKLVSEEMQSLSGTTWKTVSKITNDYTEKNGANLRGIYVTAFGSKSVQSAMQDINSASTTSVGKTDVSGMQSYTTSINWSRLTSQLHEYYGDNNVIQRSTTSFEYKSQSLIYTSTTSFANGRRQKAIYTYPFDYSDLVSTEMVNRGMISLPVEIRTEQQLSSGGVWTITGGIINSYSFFDDQDAANNVTDKHNEYILPAALYAWEQTKTNQAPLSDISAFSSLNYKLQQSLKYDAKGNLIETTNKGGKTGILWDSDGYLPVANIANAAPAEVYYTSFESNGNSTRAKTGKKSLASGSYTVPFTPPAGKDYVLSYCYYQNGGWSYREKPFTQNINEGTQLDEIRVYPKGALLTTSSYDQIGNLISETDQNGLSTYYTYNELDQVINKKDDDGNILATLEHNYSFISCDTENVQPITASFEGGEEAAGLVGQSISYKVLASGGCGDLRYTWSMIGANNVETALSEYPEAPWPSETIETPCTKYFTVKCVVTDIRKQHVATVRKFIRIESALAIDLSKTQALYCNIDSDMLQIVLDISGSCGFTYSWDYSFRKLDGTTDRLTSTDQKPYFTFKGTGTLSVTVTDSFGVSRSDSKTIGQEKTCL